MLTGLGALNVCTRYRGVEEASFDAYPYHQTVMHQAAGDYERLPVGTRTSATAATSATSAGRRDYLAYIADSSGCRSRS